MKIDIQQLVEETPNDMELGAKLREIYWELKKEIDNE